MSILEADGIQCFGLEMLHSDAEEDLRLSIGAQANEMPPPAQRGHSNSDAMAETELLSKLEQSRQEYEELKTEKEQLVYSQQEQHLHTTIEMRESIELLNEESLIKNELLLKYEKGQEKMSEEVSFHISIKFHFVL